MWLIAREHSVNGEECMAHREADDGYSEQELFRGFVLERILNEG
jgi:hypothetical protein